MKRARTSVLGDALGELAGAAIVLDAELRVSCATRAAEELLGAELPDGASAPAILAADPGQPQLEDALGRGVAFAVRPPGSERDLLVRATRVGKSGWILAIEALSGASGAPVFFHGMWTRDPALQRAFHIAERAAQRDASVLLRGETGTGKELFARAIHALSPRAAGPFAAINCAALPGALLESELFGHVRGAFTGAVRDHPGFFRSAHHGTLLLDEVSEMPLELQAKLLRVLETKTVIPVGGRDPVPVDVRILAAANQSLRKSVEAGRFRADLMYRLRVIPIILPPLRDRRGDVPLLVQKTIDELNRQGGRRIAAIAPATMTALNRYAWPGNVRELRSALEYAYVIGDGGLLEPADLPLEIVEPSAGTPEAEHGHEPPEVARVREALAKSGGNRERAAVSLGISRVTLWRKMRALGITPHP